MVALRESEWGRIERRDEKRIKKRRKWFKLVRPWNHKLSSVSMYRVVNDFCLLFV